MKLLRESVSYERKMSGEQANMSVLTLAINLLKFPKIGSTMESGGQPFIFPDPYVLLPPEFE